MEFERGVREPHNGTLALLRLAFEKAGIEFLFTEGAKRGRGLRFSGSDN